MPKVGAFTRVLHGKPSCRLDNYSEPAIMDCNSRFYGGNEMTNKEEVSAIIGRLLAAAEAEVKRTWDALEAPGATDEAWDAWEDARALEDALWDVLSTWNVFGDS